MTKSLYNKLKNCTTEEDVKAEYIKALNLTNARRGLLDIQTEEIWFEVKYKTNISSYAMFTQLLHYVQEALNKGDDIPPFLVVMDPEKASLMKTSNVIPFLEKKTIQWGKSGSKFSRDALDQVSAYIGAHMVSYRLKTHEEEFIAAIKAAIELGEILRTDITPDNLRQVFDKWITMVGVEIYGVKECDYALLFFADIMHDGTAATHTNLTAALMHKDNAPVFSLYGQMYELGNKEGYRQFWAIYNKPPKKEHRNYLLERRDSLIAIDERIFKGAYYTPLHVVDKAYEKLVEILGKNWQKNYIVWDMCCGVGNLEVKHSNPRNIYMSTLDAADVDIMHATKTCVAAQRFQYDYLNDDITEDGHIDYNQTNKIPAGLRKAIAEGKNMGKNILVLINPPYVEATSRVSSKAGVAKTKTTAFTGDYGKARNEVFLHFLARIAKEIPTATIAMFSTLKYVNAPNFEQFRHHWNAHYCGGFVFHNQAFEGLKGQFPIGFLIWKTNQGAAHKTLLTDIELDVFDKKMNPIGSKFFYNRPNHCHLNVWIDRPKANKEPVIPLKNTVSPATAVPRVTTWSDHAIGYMFCNGNDVQQVVSATVLLSSVFSAGNGFYVTPDNLWQAAIVFSVRRLVKPTWLNDRDQFLQPTEPLSDEFKNDCLVWMLFHNCQKTGSANDLEWNGKTWSFDNHFIPFEEREVDSPERFESAFMHEYLEDKDLSFEAQEVLNAGRILWKAYFSDDDERSVKDELKLDRPDVGWYQVRKALEKRNQRYIDTAIDRAIDFEPFKEAYATLTKKLHPQIYELGFLMA